MCGIFGFVGDKYDSFENSFQKSLKHRGPDDNGVYKDASHKVLLGQTRLSIIDLSFGAHQPMSDPTGRYTIVFNGEIYNFQELKKDLFSQFDFKTSSDTEVVLYAYLAWGNSCLNKFRGMFAFCVYDKYLNEFFLARDRFGIKPLIYSFENNCFTFSSELKTYLETNILSKKISPKAVQEFFTYGSVQQPNTILEGFNYLMPSHYMKVKSDNTFQINKYYNYFEEVEKLSIPDNYNEASSLLRQKLLEATEYHMVADVEVGSFLSGGVDSTAITALMSKVSPRKIKTFSLGFKNKTEVFDETNIAASTAKTIGADHHEIKVDDKYVLNCISDYIGSIDQPTFDGINTYIISKETAREVKVALSGIGGDELFAGYHHFKDIKRSRNISSFDNLKKALFSNLHPEEYRYFQYKDFSIEDAVNWKRRINKSSKNILKKNFEEATNTSKSNGSIINSYNLISKGEIDGYLLNTLLRDGDVLSMSNSLEVRPILLDHPLLEQALALPDRFKIKDGVSKSILIDAVKDLIPDEVWNRKKTGFAMPLASWLNGDLNEYFKQSLENNAIIKEFLNDDYLSRLKKRINTRTLQRKDWMTFIFISWTKLYKFD